jgi:hypothetical protein
VAIELDAPFTVEDDTLDLSELTVDQPVRGVLDGFTWDAMYTLELEEGDEIEIALRAGTSDPYFWLLAPGEGSADFDAEPDADDGGGGLYDLDAKERFTIDESGTWRLVFGTYDGTVTGYELTVNRTD